ncbi:MAG: DUF1553 domain-containing protein [Bryobacterales bacterium]|nr:DUF1553 domain-containing protein [Bryobacterales bacterium]
MSEIVASNCLGCHGAAVKMSDLDLRTRESMLKGGKSGAVLVPGDPMKSKIYRHVAGIDQPQMPPGKKLQDWQITVISRWIGTGAPLDKPIEAPADTAKKAMAAMEERPISEEERQFWSFRPIARPETPVVADAGWVRTPIDAFVLKTLANHKLKPSPTASKRALVRRAYLDVWGLPPTPAQVDAFLNDKRPDAWEKLVDQLLASPHYGERWGSHWLDLARYADSGGFEYDRDRPDAWRYRDWVIQSIANDLPYDQFVRLQLAGDEIAPDDRDALIATGFLRHGLDHNVKSEMTRMDELDDLVVTTSNSFLGVTVGCARCHNHKFDPIPQKDYYRIQAVFFSTKDNDVPLVDEGTVRRFKADNKRIDDIEKPLKDAAEALKKPYRDRKIAEERAKLPDYVREALRTPPEKRTEGQKLNVIQVEKTRNFTEADVVASMSAEDRARLEDLERQIKAMEKTRPNRLPSAMAIGEGGPKPDPSYFLYRGSPDSKGSLMQPGVLSVATRHEPEFSPPPPGARSSYRRKAFAEWLTSQQNPLFARVMVNRIWQHHFGEGIVRTPSNFGKTGERPTDPELLDWLASEFIRKDYSMKAMHKLMLMSAAYQMSSDDNAAGVAADPENRFLWRMPRQRLEGEIIRDNMLAVSGTLDAKTGGPGVFPFIDPSLFQGSSGRTWAGKPDNDPSTWRRSIYIHSKRSIPLPMLDVFDKPDGITSCPRRNRSTIAPQALILMNNSFVRFEAEQFARRLEREAGADPGKQVDLAFALAFQRRPDAAEKATAVKFLDGGKESLQDFCQAIFNSNEFVYAP